MEETKETSYLLSSVQNIKDFLNTYSYNYGRISEIKFLAKGGENAIYQIEPFVPIETVAKVSLVEGTLDLLLEN